jgi:hypothetical protein
MAFDVTRQEILKQANDLLRLYKQTRDQKYKDEENRLRRIVADLEAFTDGGATDLDGLSDVTISAPANAQVLTYNSTTSQWENQTPTGGGGGGDMLKATYDVDNDGVVDASETTQIIVRNSTGSTLLKGQVVYLSGATGNRPNAFLSQANTEAASSKTIGIVVANISNNSDGYVAVSGTLHNLDTSAFADGVAVWLSATTAGGMTSTIPAEPNHTVFIGYIARSHPTQGRLVIAIQNGYELNELHGVLIASPTDGQVLKYNQALGVWENGDGGSVLYTKTLVAYRTMLQPSGTTMNLSLDGTGVTGLIEPTVPNATWNVTIDTIATVINVIGDAPGMSIGDTYSETTRLVFKRIGGISTLVAIVSSEAGFDASMTTALMNYSVGGSQNLNLQFQFPTFAGAGSVQINAISKLEIVEATY